MGRYLSATAEYRIPIVRDVGLAFLGLYFQMFTLAPFVDALAWNDAGAPVRDIRENAQTAWTTGLTGRQRIYFMGKQVIGLNLHFYYDIDKSGYGFAYNFLGETGF